MAGALPNLPDGFEQLPQDDKLAYIQRLYEVVDAEGIELTDDQRALLDERLQHHHANPSSARPWSEVRGELLERWR